LQEKLKAAERKAEGAEEKAEEKWNAWVEKESQVKAGKAVSAEGKNLQAKGKALPVEKVTIATQTDHIREPTVVQVDKGTQAEAGLEELEQAMEKKRERKGKGRAKDSEDIVMKDGSNNSDIDREMYEDLSGYEDEDEALVAAPLATKKTCCSTFGSKPGWEPIPTSQNTPSEPIS